MEKNLLQITANGVIGKLIYNGVDLSKTVTGIDIKIRAGEYPEVTIMHDGTDLETILKDCNVKIQQSNQEEMITADD